MDEIWKPIPDFDGYEASNYGRIRSLKFKKQKVLKAAVTKDGYHKVGPCKNKKNVKVGVHRLVAMAFLPNPDCKPKIDHIDRNPSNNHLSNLRWCSDGENGANRPGTSITGYKGVHRSLEKFYAKIYHNRKFIYLGTYETARLAHDAYKRKALELYGEFACMEHVNGFLDENPLPATNVINMTEVAESPTSSVYSQETDSDDESVSHAFLDEPTLYVRTLERIDGGVTLSWS
jgi:hypothetical protein